MPAFSRAQLGVFLLVAGLLLGLYAWRGNPGWLPLRTQGAAPQPVLVEVTGEAARPGVYAFAAPPTLPEVWRQAGGPHPAPDADAVLLPGSCLEITEEGEFSLERMSGDQLLTLGVGLDLNTATAEDLEALPGVGPTLAQRIIQRRQIQGPYNKVEDLLTVYGMGAKKLAQIKPMVTVSSPEK
ncbi:MAG: helix-hairpin-helix domain-containing protein [Desulfobaccales bacterium]